MNTETIQRMQAADELGDAEEPRDYVFTFGAEHTYGIKPMRDRYVRFHGTYMEARLKMIAVFGVRWCAQYDSEEDAQVERFQLIEFIPPDNTPQETT